MRRKNETVYQKMGIDDKSDLAINLNNPKAWNITNRTKLVHVLLMTMELMKVLSPEVVMRAIRFTWIWNIHVSPPATVLLLIVKRLFVNT